MEKEKKNIFARAIDKIKMKFGKGYTNPNDENLDKVLDDIERRSSFAILVKNNSYGAINEGRELHY